MQYANSLRIRIFFFGLSHVAHFLLTVIVSLQHVGHCAPRAAPVIGARWSERQTSITPAAAVTRQHRSFRVSDLVTRTCCGGGANGRPRLPWLPDGPPNKRLDPTPPSIRPGDENCAGEQGRTSKTRVRVRGNRAGDESSRRPGTNGI